MGQLTRPQLMAKLKLLDLKDKTTRNEIVCSLIGHSRISSFFMGYRHCGRCEALLGDSLGGIDPAITDAVIIGHNCDTCQANYAKCDWRDKLYVPNPFKEEK